MLGMSRRQIYRVIDAGDLQAFREGKSRRVSRRAIEAYIERREKQARAERAEVA